MGHLGQSPYAQLSGSSGSGCVAKRMHIPMLLYDVLVDRSLVGWFIGAPNADSFVRFLGYEIALVPS